MLEPIHLKDLLHSRMIKSKSNIENKSLQQGNDLSSCVPIYVDKIPEIDNSLTSRQGEESEGSWIPNEETILDNTKISNILMTFSEFFLAYKLAASKKYSLILMDRSLSNTYLGLTQSTSARVSWSSNCSIYGIEVDCIPIDTNDLAIARHSFNQSRFGASSEQRRLLAICNIEQS